MKKEYPIPLSGFVTKKLVLKCYGFFDVKLFCDENLIKKTKGCYVVQNDAGQDVQIYMQPKLYDPYSRVRCGDEVICIVPPLKTYEYVWNWLPLLIVPFGGGLAGGAAVIVGTINMLVFRGVKNKILK